MACSEHKSTSEKETTIDSTSAQQMEKISPDGTVNATLKCEGSSQIQNITIKGNQLITSEIKCQIINSNTLSISFISDAFDLKLELFEAGNMPFNMGEYKHMTKGNLPYAVVHYQNKTNGQKGNDLTLEIFEGSVALIDYGMSSNILCGKFQISDNEGNNFSGTFSEDVLYF